MICGKYPYNYSVMAQSAVYFEFLVVVVIAQTQLTYMLSCGEPRDTRNELLTDVVRDLMATKPLWNSKRRNMQTVRCWLII